MALLPLMRRIVHRPDRAGAAAPSERRVRIAKFGMYLAGFMAVVNISVVYLALPSIEHAIRADIDEQEWILSIYPLMEGGFTLAAGTLGDLYGRKKVMTLMTWLFTLATIACALAPSPLALIVARGFQGLGGAALLSLPVAILVQMLPDPADNEDAIKNFAMVAGLGAVAGPAIGGVLVHFLGWPSIFYLSVLMSAGVLLSLPSTEESKRDPSLRIDGIGQFLSIGSFLAISFGLIEGNDLGWTSPVILGAFVLSVVLIAAFLYAESRVAQPMVHLRYFKVPRFNVSLLTIGGINFAWYGVMLLCTLFLQNALHQSAMASGFYLMPSNIAFFLANQYSSRVERRTGALGIILLAFAISIAGMAWLGVLGASAAAWEVSAGLFIAGIGWGFAFTPAASMGMAAASSTDEGFASGAEALARSLFGVFGIAVLGSILAAGISGGSFVGGLHLALYVCIGLTVVIGIAVFLLLSRPSIRALTRTTRGPSTSSG
jgi:DHA2 family methylenomycin A resistance protein-like MFS transporter